ncbi:immunity 49 family protein [Actinomadura barringtoniae]|uniref:Immunity 49 family protein n=1 Tax=Actinomadura barringtoniae TaxID=1427535 RepID=A0A939PDX4_9ACTN|nr:Imm49 family immunity protein [Actinomadura barringtoniae]MBO2450452.1 immunity 49 family protein [Actinomadura barringtoniae]
MSPRHAVDDDALSKALSAVPGELDREVARAENGGAFGIKILTDMLRDYAAARSVADPAFEQRDSWAALRSSAELATYYVNALETESGGEVRAWVEYLGVGFGYEAEGGEEAYPHDWIAAFCLALICREDKQLRYLHALARTLRQNAQTPYVQALDALWADVAGLAETTETAHGPDGAAADVVPPGRHADEIALLNAIGRGDAAAFGTGLAALIEAHREQAKPDHVRHLIAWEPLALAVLAHDSGLKVEVETDYLPHRLITGEGPKKVEAGGRVVRPPFAQERAAAAIAFFDKNPPDRVGFPLSPTIITTQRPNAFRSAAGHLLESFSLRPMVDPEVTELRLWTDLRLASQAWTAAFTLASAPEDTPVTVTLAGRSEELPASGPVSCHGPWYYGTAIACALAARATEDLAVLREVTDETLAAGGAHADTKAYVRGLRALLRGEDPRAHVDAALSTTSGDDHWECLCNPRVRLLDRLVADDVEGFNRVLAEALELYLQYYSSPTQEDEAEGQYSLDALALACAAHDDKGWKIEVDSDYLPEWIVTGALVGTPADLTPYA